MRLTKKTQYGYENESCEITECSDKLGQLEDIEDELGIDLITYFKLLQTTKVWVYSNNGKWEITLTGVNPYDKMVNLWNGICHIEYPLSEYGKAFALTKEELEKQ